MAGMGKRMNVENFVLENYLGQLMMESSGNVVI
jgi:hypothetical protein